MSKGLLSHCFNWCPATEPAHTLDPLSAYCQVKHERAVMNTYACHPIGASPAVKVELNCGSGAVATRVALEVGRYSDAGPLLL